MIIILILLVIINMIITVILQEKDIEQNKQHATNKINNKTTPGEGHRRPGELRHPAGRADK